MGEIPHEDFKLGLQILKDACGGYSSMEYSRFDGDASSIHIREGVVSSLSSIMQDYQLELSPEWQYALNGALEVDNAKIIDGKHRFTMRAVWQTAYVAIHDGILRSKGMDGIEAQVLDDHLTLPYQLIDYYSPPDDVRHDMNPICG